MLATTTCENITSKGFAPVWYDWMLKNKLIVQTFPDNVSWKPDMYVNKCFDKLSGFLWLILLVVSTMT